MAFPPPGAQDPNPSSLPSGGPIPGTLHLLPLRERLALVTETMRELSRQTDPQNMAKVYLRHLRQLLPNDGLVAVSRRDLPSPHYRVTRSSRWKEEIDPWLQREKLPVVTGGILGDLLYGNEPRILEELRVEPGDPASTLASRSATPRRSPRDQRHRSIVRRNAGAAARPFHRGG